ncbi:MAG: acylphosphatase [Lachnospiraceae bacterium]|nr:acylphosphatase [Lachnospiraceae bacterium]
MADKIRKKIRFHGRVQGVGFRYHAMWAARPLGLTGWVKNEWDGTVSMEVQGDRESINRMLEHLNSDAYIRIEWMDTKEIPLDEEESGFRVR